MDSLVLNKFPFDKLPSLHSITASILLRHAKELNHRWLLPVFNAPLYLYTHLTENESICSPSLVLECHHCLSLFPAVYLFSLLFTSVPVGNPLFPDFLAMLDHSLHIATSPPREPSLFDFAPLFPALSTRRPAELPAKLLETLAGTNHIPAGDARNRVYFYTLVRVLLTRLARLPAGKLTLFAEQFSRQLLAVPANVMGIFSSLPRNARELAGTEFGDIFALAAALAVIVTADMVPVNLRYLGRERFVPESAVRIRPTEADLQILADTAGEPGYRVLNLTVSPFNDASTSYFHRSVGGYHGAKLHRYQDLIEHHLSKMNWNVYDMLNTRYVIAPSDDGRGASVQRNDGANGAAWFVDEVRIVADPDEEIDALDSVDTKRVAVVDKRFAGMLEGVSVTADSSASIRMTEYRVNRHTYEYSAAAEGVAVFSEIYYPHGWTAYVDGQEAPYFRADYVLRAMKLPAGDHVVEFRFRAPHYETLTVVTLVCSLLLLLSLAAAVGVAAVRKRKTEQTATENGCGQE